MPTCLTPLKTCLDCKMIKIIIFCLTALILVVFLRQIKPEYSLIATVTAGAAVLIYLAVELYTPLLKILDRLNSYGISNSLTAYILKAMGICLITKFGAELCTDFGQSSLASKVELAGKTAVFILSLPLIEEILNTGINLL